MKSYGEVSPNPEFGFRNPEFGHLRRKLWAETLAQAAESDARSSGIRYFDLLDMAETLHTTLCGETPAHDWPTPDSEPTLTILFAGDGTANE